MRLQTSQTAGGGRSKRTLQKRSGGQTDGGERKHGRGREYAERGNGTLRFQSSLCWTRCRTRLEWERAREAEAAGCGLLEG